MTSAAPRRLPMGELLRYAINGVVATAAHFGTLTFNLRVLDFSSAGWANFCAALVGIAVSFLGSRYFVYARTGQTFLAEAARFAGLYGAIAVLHGLVLSAWTDWLGLDYRWGFLIATGLQVSLSYLGKQTSGVQTVKVFRAILATVCFLALLVGIYLAHMRFLPVDVVFYASIADGVIAAMLMGLALLVLRTFRVFSGFEKVQMVVIWMLMGYAFAISVPTVIDRSLSFYILEKIQQRGGGIQRARFADVFTQEYLPEHRLVDVRLTEQRESGTIVIENGCVKLTDKGRQLAAASRYFRQHFLPKRRLLMGEYSADLTDPFRHSKDIEDYKCQ